MGGDSPAVCSTVPRTRRLESASALLHETQVPQNLMSPYSSGSEAFEVVGRYLNMTRYVAISEHYPMWSADALEDTYASVLQYMSFRSIQ